MTVPDQSGLPDLPGGGAITRVLRSGLHVPEYIGATANETTFPQDLADQLKALEEAIEQRNAAPAVADPAPAPEQPDPVPEPVAEQSPPAPRPEPAVAVVEEPEEKIGNIFRRAARRFAKRKLEGGERDTSVKHTPWPIVVMTGLFATASTAGAFVLSFTMLILVMQAMGFSAEVSWLGPIAIDIAALTAATFLVTKDPHYRRLGWFLLIISTGASIYGNLVGHAIQDARAVVPFHLPNNLVYGAAGIFFSIFWPTVMAVLVHCFMAQLTGNLEYRKLRKAELEQAERQREAEAKAEAERQARAEAARAERDKLLAALPKPKRGEVATKAVGIAYGVAHEATTFAPLRDVLVEAGYKLPASETTVKNWLPEIRKELGLA